MDQQPTPNMNRENFNKYSLDVQREIPSAGSCVARSSNGTRKSRPPLRRSFTESWSASTDRNDADLFSAHTRIAVETCLRRGEFKKRFSLYLNERIITSIIMSYSFRAFHFHGARFVKLKGAYCHRAFGFMSRKQRKQME